VDFVDSALSFHHSINPQMVQRFSTEYVALVDPFAARLLEADRLELLPQSAIDQMRFHLAGGRRVEQAA
jgi:hypothetical protein